MKYAIRIKGTETYLGSAPGQRPVSRVEDARSFVNAATAFEYANRGTSYEVVSVEQKSITQTREVLLSNATRYALKLTGGGLRPYVRLEGRQEADFGETTVAIIAEASHGTITELLIQLQERVRATHLRYGAVTIVGVADVARVDYVVTPVANPRRLHVFPITGSTAISAIGYDAKNRVAHITFKPRATRFATHGERTGGTYEYSNVDAADIFAFLEAESKGTHFAQVWKAKYDRSAVKVNA